MISASTGIARILEKEGAAFVTLFPSCKINNAIGDEGKIPLILMRDERFGVGVADAFSRLSDGKRFGVCTLQGGVNCPGLQFGIPAITQAFEDSSPVLCLTDAVNPGDTENSHYHIDVHNPAGPARPGIHGTSLHLSEDRTSRTGPAASSDQPG
jgi:thiamine pyrophosphate-dependent acetolactate synthase large subunit-like protein